MSFFDVVIITIRGPDFDFEKEISARYFIKTHKIIQTMDIRVAGGFT
jgi:hypothetical protein